MDHELMGTPHRSSVALVSKAPFRSGLMGFTIELC
jgi:hypothetical protein